MKSSLEERHGATKPSLATCLVAVLRNQCCQVVRTTKDFKDPQDHDEKRVGIDDLTRASFPFLHGLALADAGHEVQIFLTGEATYLMRKVTANTVMPVGWPPLSETLEKIVAKHIPVFS